MGKQALPNNVTDEPQVAFHKRKTTYLPSLPSSRLRRQVLQSTSDHVNDLVFVDKCSTNCATGVTHGSQRWGQTNGFVQGEPSFGGV